MAKTNKKKNGLSKTEDIKLGKISIFFRKSILKNILKIMTMEHGGFRNFKSVKNINRLFANLDMSKYTTNPEACAYIWCIAFMSKQWLAGIATPDIAVEMAKHQADAPPLAADILTQSLEDKNDITAPEAKTLFDMISEALQYGFVTTLKEDYINLLDDVNMDEPGALQKVLQRLFDVSKSLLDIKYNTNMVANKVEFNTADIDSVQHAVTDTIESLTGRSSILKTGIRRLNTLLSPGYMNGRLYVYLGLPASGKAQPNDTLIPTPSGFKRMGDLKVGDYVFNDMGKPVTISHVFPQGLQKTYRITFEDGRSTRCNIDHLWKIYKKCHGKYKPQVMTLRELMEGYEYIAPGDPFQRIHHKYMIDASPETEFPSAPVPIDPWVMGYIIGNGCCREKDFKVSAPDGECPHKIASHLGLYPVKEKGENYSWFFRRDPNVKSRVSTKETISQINEVYQRYSHEKRIPTEYIFNSAEVRWELVRGLMDSDGSITIDKRESKYPKYTVAYSSTSLGLLEDFQLILESLGYSSHIYGPRITATATHEQWALTLHIPNSDVLKFFSVSYKYKKACSVFSSPNFKRYEFNLIVKIERVNDTEQTCIMVDDPSHMYLTEHFIPTHNSTLLLKSALDIRKYNPGYVPKTPGMKPCVLYVTMENTFTETIERIWNMCYDDPITNYTEDEAMGMICDALGITKVIKDHIPVTIKNDSGEMSLEAQLLAKENEQNKSNIEIVCQYYPYRSINTDDLNTIIADLHDENMEVCALVFDYIKRIEPAVPIADNVKLELNRIINELKAIAVIRDIPVITAHQMNRAAASVVDAAARAGKADVNKLVGRENVGDAWEVMETADWAAVLNSEYRPGTDEKYLTINVVKRRRIDAAEAEFAKYTYLAHPFAPKNGLRLLDDINLDKVLSLQSLSNDMDVLPDKEKANAVPRLQTLTRTPFDEDYE